MGPVGGESTQERPNMVAWGVYFCDLQKPDIMSVTVAILVITLPESLVYLAHSFLT